MASAAKLTLYTNHGCPWAHRAHIALEELKLPFEEVIIDLNTPRSPEYLKINPRGLVPTLVYNDEIITESGIVAQFLADAYPSRLIQQSNSHEGALRRARVAFFVDTYLSKFQPRVMKALLADTETEANAALDGAVSELVKEVDPLLADAKPFFGGSENLTLAEVLTGSFVLRIYAFSKSGVLPKTLVKTLQERAPNFSKWAEAVTQHPSVISIFDEAAVVKGVERMRAKHRSQA